MQAAQFVEKNLHVCHASWKPGPKTLNPGLNLAGKMSIQQIVDPRGHSIPVMGFENFRGGFYSEIREQLLLRNVKFILSHAALSRYNERGNEKSNIPYFKEDLENGKLDSVRGHYVVYWKGILCGYSQEGETLFIRAGEYFGNSNLAVFRVPQKNENLEAVLREAQGQF